MKLTAIVTGAGTGIGRATALRLSTKGHAVALVGRTAATLEAVAAEIRAAAGTALVVAGDVSQPAAAEGIVRQVVDAWERVDALVNCAGAAPSEPLAEMSVDHFHAVLDANLSSAFYMTRSVWPWMKGQGSGVIVNISSRAARDPFAGLGAYAIAKSGVNMLTLVTAREGAAIGIRVVGIAPGAVNTQMFRTLVGEANVREQEILRPEDVAAAIGEAVGGSLRYASGETVYLHHGPA